MATNVNISSYSGSVTAGDWSPAVTAALAAISGGGTVNIDTDITLKSQISIVAYGAAYSYNFVGDMGTTVTIDAGTTTNVFYCGNQNYVSFSNINFVGKQTDSTAPNTADCGSVILVSYVEKCTITNCLFAGVKSTNGIVYAAAASELYLQNCKFGGGGLNIVCETTRGLVIENCAMYDYQTYKANYYDRQSVGSQWIKCFSPPASTSSFAPYIRISGFRGDEGAGKQIVITDYPRVILEHCIGNFGGGGIYLTNVDHASLKQCWAGYNSNGANALVLDSCGYVEVDGHTVHAGDHPFSITNSRTLLKNITPATGSLTVTVEGDEVQRLTAIDSPDLDISCGPGYASLHTFQNTTEVVPTR